MPISASTYVKALKSGNHAGDVNIRIPPQPEVLQIAQRESGAETPDLLRIAEAVRKDPALAAEFLKVVNSPQFALPTKIVSIPQAVSYLGLSQSVCIIATVEIRRAFKSVPGISLHRFWDTASDVARHCASIARRMALTKPEEAYAVGLFHDCGIPMMAQKFADYPKVLREANNSANERFTAVEARHYRTHHAVVGHLVTRAWHLPGVIREAVLSHHDADLVLPGLGPRTSPLGNCLAVLKLAEHACDVFRNRPEHEWMRVKSAVLEYLMMTPQECEELTADLVQAQQTFR